MKNGAKAKRRTGGKKRAENAKRDGTKISMRDRMTITTE